MNLLEISSELQIPVQIIKSYLSLNKIFVDNYTNLSVKEEDMIRSVSHVMKSQLENEKHDPSLQNEIENEINNYTEINNEHKVINTTPRVMAAARRYNISYNTLVDFLVSSGFSKDELKPSGRLTEEMYEALENQFQTDILAKIESDQILSSKSIGNEDEMNWEGIVTDNRDKDKVKICFIKYEHSYKNGKPIKIAMPDNKNWVIAMREDWDNYVFNQDEKIIFSIKVIDRENRKIRAAIPPIKNSNNNNKEDLILDYNAQNQKRRTDEVSYNTKVTDTEDHKHTPSMNQKIKNMYKNNSPIQKILFGSPGTGKSFKIVDAENSYFRQLIIGGQKPDLIKTVFHSEYTYGDFMGKLMPLTINGRVEYRYYSGHFMLAIGIAYKNIIKAYIEYTEKIEEIEKEFKLEKKKNKSDYSEEDKQELQKRVSEVEKPIPKNVMLVIDEINRGNSAAIFGTVFQLLDRDNQGWSSYPVRISDLELKELLNVTGLYDVKEGKVEEVGTRFCGDPITRSKYDNYLKSIFSDLDEDKRISLSDNYIKIPPNLSIIATMNTSDNSIYFMDSAFKRRWDWEFVDITSNEQRQMQSGRILEDGFPWDEFVDNLNEYIKKYGERIRKIEDKQIGYFFIKGDVITHESIRNKLMFFLWDSIFNNDKRPIKELIGNEKTLVTFGDFINHYDVFISAIKGKTYITNVL